MKMNRRNLIRLGVLLMMLVLLLPLLPQGQAASLYTVKSTSSATLAPGITQKIHTATYPNDTRTVKYYVATADISRGDVMVLNGYKDNKPLYNSYVSATVDKQVIASEKVHQDPADPRYIENYRVVAACNGGFFNIPSISGIEGVSGAHVMEGVQYWPYDGRPFFAILKDGSAVVGAGDSDWNKYREHMWEAISGNVLLVNKGANNTGNVDEDKAFVGQESSKLGTGRHPRTCVGITKDGKVVMMVIDAQATASSASRGGATLNEAAQMLIDAGCYYAINMDGGGSSTYMTKAEGATEPKLMNVPSDSGKMRAICGSLLFASVAPTDHLSFEFDGTGSQRYMREMYSKRNYDLASYWATGLAGSLTLKNYGAVMDTTAGTMTINLNDRTDGSHSTYFAPGAKDGTFDEAKATTSTAFTYVPSNAEVFRIRLKFTDAKRYSSSNTPFVAVSYLTEDTRTWSGWVIKANIADEYLDGGAKEGQFVTLEVDLTNHKIRNANKLVSLMIQIGDIVKGSASIDTIYLGPKPGNQLNIGFSELGTDPSAYNDPAYGYLNFDKEGHWYKGAELTSYDINHGIMTIKVDNSPSNVNNAYVETSLTSGKSVHPLRYTPKSGDIIQIRYRVQSYDATTNSSLYGTQVPTMSVYGYNDRQNVYKNITANLNTTSKEYVVGQWAIPSGWTSYDMSKLRITLRYFVNSTLQIDSIYVGPKSEAPAYDKLYIGFDDTAADRKRYESVTYGGMNMDKVGSWSIGTEYSLPVVSGGAIKMTPAASGYTGYGYIHSGGGTGAYPLSYKPGADDYIQVRFKIDNGVSSDRYEAYKGIGRFAFFYGNKDLGWRNSYVHHDFKVADVSNKGYVIFTYKLKDMKTNGTNITAVNEVTCIAPCFNWIVSASGKTVNFYIDYIYLGPLSGVPTPQYTVTFKGATGNTLATQTVYKGSNATYTGATPTKAADATNHYTFKGWDKALTNIQANTTITAQFTATAHTWTYSKVDGTNHKAACSCGYSKTEGHSYSYKETKNPTISATGVLTGTCSRCSGTTTVTLPKLNTTDYTKSTTKAPTCTETGTDSYKWNTTTYGTFTFTATTNALGHSYTTKVTAPTCTAQGYTTHTCSRCSNSYKDSYVNAKGHTEVIDKAVAATCTASGKTEGKHCSVCNTILVAQEVVPALGHTEMIDKAVAPTCTASGKTEGKHCSVCNTVLVKQETVAALGHSYTNKVTAPTCTAQGYTTYTCSRCSHSYKDNYVNAKGHTEVIDKAVAATCTATGLTEGKHCSVCNTVLVAQEVVPSKGHSYTNKVTAPTCTAQGYTTYTCSRCSHSYKDNYVAAKGHTEVIDKAVAATCTASGKTEGKHCSVCNTVLVAQETIPALGHSYTYTTVDAMLHMVGCENCDLAEKAPHSYAEGFCICGEKEIKEPVELPTLKLGHTLNLASDISVNFVILKQNLEGFDPDSIYVECVLDTYEGNEKTGTQTMRLESVDKGIYYYFTLTGLTAVQMNDSIATTLYGTKDGQVYISPVDTYSIATYAYSQMNNPDRAQSLKILCADLLRYGSAAQIFKSYRLDALADSAMTEEHKAYLSDIEAVTFGNTNVVLNDLPNAPITWAGKSLNLESKVALKFVFNPANYVGDLSALTLRISYTDAYGNTKTATAADPVLYNAQLGYYVFTVDSLLAAELRAVVSVQIYAGNTPVSATLQYSPDTYGNNKTGTLLDLCKALFAYSDSAKAYFAP